MNTLRHWFFAPLILFFTRQEARIMSAIDDLNTAVARNTASVAALTAAVGALPKPADLSAQVAAINASSDALDAETAAITPAP